MGKASTKAASPSLSVRLFGAARFDLDGEPVKFAKRDRTIALLARLILARGAPLARNALAFTIFPDEDEVTALAELRRYLYLAGKALGPAAQGASWLPSDGETVRWNLDGGAAVDVLEFEACARDAATYERAFDVYAGDLLEDLYDEWIVVERERLRTRYLQMLGESLEHYRSERRFSQAIACAGRILATDPWREDTLRALVNVRYESGDTAGAIAEYERFARRLRDDLAIAPMAETIALRDLIVRGETPAGTLPARRAAGGNDGAPRAAAILPFVGRAAELDAAQALWTRAVRGGARLLIVEGEAGAGKSRLAAELARRVQSEGGRTFAGTTSAPESSPYQAIVEALRAALPLLRVRPPNDARRAALAPMLPELDDGALGARAASGDAAGNVARVHDALADAIRRLASGRPLLLVLEDLHWAGDATLEALAAVVRELGPAPVLVVVTCRGEETPPGHGLRRILRSLEPAGLAAQIALPRLSEADVADLVTRIDGLHAAPGFAHELFMRSEGNALFLNEFVSSGLEGGAAAPSTIAAVIATRLSRLSEVALTIAEIAAVAGAGCTITLVRDVAGAAPAELARGFDELLDRRIVREAGARARHDYVFTHHLIAEAVYAGIAAPMRARRHARIARLLEAESVASAAGFEREIARHYEAAAENESAAAWYARAATAAANVHAYGDTIALAGHGLALRPNASLERSLREIRERAHDVRGERAEQRADIDALERLAGSDPRLRFEVLRRRIALARTLGELDREGALIEGLHAFEDALGDEARAEALLQRAIHAAQGSRPLEAAAAASDALDLFDRLGDTRRGLECLLILVDTRANMGDFAASRAHLTSIHERAADVGDKLVEARAITAAATAALLRHDYRICRELSLQALAIAEAIGDRDAEAAAQSRLGAVNAWLGGYAEALRDFERALATYASIGNKRGLALTYTNRTLLLMRLGLFDEALDSIARSSELFAVAGERRTMVANRVNESFVRLQLGDAPAAKSLAQSALELAREIHFPIFEAAALANLGNAERALGNYAAALDAMERGIALRRPLQEPRDFADDLSDLALAYADAGRGAAAAAVAEELCAIDGGTFSAALWPHYVRWAIACGFAASGDATRAAESAARARAELEAFARTIDDERARTAFLAIPINRTIADGLERLRN